MLLVVRSLTTPGDVVGGAEVSGPAKKKTRELALIRKWSWQT